MKDVGKGVQGFLVAHGNQGLILNSIGLLLVAKDKHKKGHNQ